MRVVHVSPTYMGPNSLIGGAERYTTELASAMAQKIPTRLVSFGDRSRREQWGPLEVHIYRPLAYIGGLRWNPLSVGFLSSLRDADVIHCHQFASIPTDLSILLGSLLRKRVFVTDLGGNANFSLSYHLPLWKGIRCLLPISEFSKSLYQKLPVRARVIYGGVDTERFCPSEDRRQHRLLHVGRILPHKGIHLLLEALPQGVGLDIVGPAVDESYLRLLQEKAQGKDVQFYTHLRDEEMIHRYRLCLATVLPATLDSGFTTAMESFSCGTPVIAASVGSLPEIIREGLTGFLIPPNNAAALRERIETLLAHPSETEAMGRRARNEALLRFTWSVVVERCLAAYVEENSEEAKP